ncbi:MAG: hypothetical protein KJ645_01275 [Planctomycetes bacterium]|nr:hypothetical protein [Planctomycetota bacterium]
MSSVFRGILFLAIIIFCCVLMPALYGSSLSQGLVTSDEEDLDQINAVPWDAVGVYHVAPVLKVLKRVEIVKTQQTSDSTPRVLKDQDWSFDKKTGRLRIKVSVDDKKESVVVYGKRVMPWAFKMQERLEPGSVKILLGDHAAVEGVDFEVDASEGYIGFLREEDSDPTKDYYISFMYRKGPGKSSLSRGGAIGNHRDRKAVRRFLDLPEEDAPMIDRGSSVGTNASFTGDPKVFTLMQPMHAEGMQVAVAKKGGSRGDLKWLSKEGDYTYDEETGIITLLKEIGLNRDKDYLFVSGVVKEKNLFLFHEAIEQGSIKVYVNDGWIREGKGFRVDYAQGRLLVLDPRITLPGAKYFIRTDTRAFGNMAPPDA